MPMRVKCVQARTLTSSNRWKNKTSTGLRGGRGHEEAGRGHLCPSWLDRHGWEGRDYVVEPTALAPACSRERAKAWIKRPRAPSVPAFPKYFSLVLVAKLSDCRTEKKSSLRVQIRADHHRNRRNASEAERRLWPSVDRRTASSCWSRRVACRSAVPGSTPHCRALGD
jgi:hypothetical protein